MSARTDLFSGVDLTKERDLDALPRRPRWRGLVLIGAVLALFALGLALGYGIARWSRPTAPPEPALESAVPAALPGLPALDLRGAEAMVESRLADIALTEARLAVGEGVLGSGRVLQALADAPATQEVPMRIQASDGPVRVRVDGRDVEPVARDVYRVRRSRPVEVEFVPAPPGLDRPAYFELVVTPLLELEQYDPYRPPRR